MIGQKITAADGKVFRRISDGMLLGSDIHLGMAYPVEGVPYEELPEHFEEVDAPEEIVMDEDTPLVEEAMEAILPNEPEEQPVKRVVTLSDYEALEKKVELLMQMIGGTI